MAVYSRRDQPKRKEKKPLRLSWPREFYLKRARSLLRNGELALVHRRQDVHRLLPVDLAADRKGRPEHLPHRPLELFCLALEAHLASDVEERVLRDVAAVGDVLHLLAVTHRLLQLLDDQTRRRRDEVDLRLAVLDRELHENADALPGHARLDDVVPDLLRRQAERANLRRQHRRRGGLT